MKSAYAFTLFLLLIAHIAAPAQAANDRSWFDRLIEPDRIQLTLVTDVSALIRNKNTVEYQSGALNAADGKSYDVEVRPRGKFRRRVSEIPPLKIKIKKKLLRAEGLVDSLNELKLVLPTTFDPEGEALVIREYLAYRMFERLSPLSARARLIDLTMINTDANENRSNYTCKAILLEDEEETAARLGGAILDAYGLTPDSLPADQMALIAVFQYMIGNTDWNIPEQRNIRFIRMTGGKIIPVPFDFDFCGLVNAPYASPTADSGLRNVRQRFLMAEGLGTAELAGALRVIREQQQYFYTLIRDCPFPDKSSDQLVAYLDAFYRETPSWEKGR